MLLIEDEPASCDLLGAVLRGEGYDVVAVTDGAEAMARLDRETFDVVVCDIRLPSVDGLTIFYRLREQSPGTPVILMSAYGTVTEAVEAMKARAAHYLVKPFAVTELIEVVREAAHNRRLREQLEAVIGLDSLVSRVVGQSRAIELLRQRIREVAHGGAPVVITGEAGAGKKLVARAIHEMGPRASGPFVTICCGAFPGTQLEAELLGFEPGAFAGALERREGRFRQADGGTLFLDQVAEMSPAAQLKLLRLLEDGTYQPLGTNVIEKVDLRLISAAGIDLAGRVEEGELRSDLYYRLKIFHLHLPPLRERREDLPLLLRHFHRQLVAGGVASEPLLISPRAWAALEQYSFPGNVRELRQAVEHAHVLAGPGEVDLEHLPREIRGAVSGASEKEEEAAAALRPLAQAVRDFEREYLTRALRQGEGRRGRVAQRLGISRKTLWEKLRRYGISGGEKHI